MPRFVVLYHEMPAGAARSSHWDFMLEVSGALRTWALDRPPVVDETMPAQALADHRLAYLDYEGPVAGDRGAVTRWDRGDYEIVEESRERLVVKLTGERLRGRITLEFI